MLLCLFVFEFSIVSSNQICDAFDQGACPSDTCCKQSVCDDEGGTYKCCTDAGIGCSNCPTCGKLIDIYNQKNIWFGEKFRFLWHLEI